MKKLLSLLLVLGLLLSFCACGAQFNDAVNSATGEMASVQDALESVNQDLESFRDEFDTIPSPETTPLPDSEEAFETLDENGTYTSKDDVALYIYTYGCLPDNFITKKEARALGWESGSLEDVAPGKCIGGDRFGNYEGLLPKASGRTYTECDIDTLGASKRGAKRIVFSNDGLIYYTDDHYESFTLLYGEE